MFQNPLLTSTWEQLSFQGGIWVQRAFRNHLVLEKRATGPHLKFFVVLHTYDRSFALR